MEVIYMAICIYKELDCRSSDCDGGDTTCWAYEVNTPIEWDGEFDEPEDTLSPRAFERDPMDPNNL